MKSQFRLAGKNRKTLLVTLLTCVFYFSQSSYAQPPFNSDSIQSKQNTGKQDDSQQNSCTYAREYITSLAYLRSHKDFAIPEDQARQLAWDISQGCTGAAYRFIKVTAVLARSGLSANNSIQMGLAFVKRTDAEMQSFVSIFMRSFLEEYLNLDLRTSLRLAQSLTTEFSGDLIEVRKDFEKLVDFCIESKSLDLPRPECASFAAHLARQGNAFEGGIAHPFIKLFWFLRSSKGPDLTTKDALQLAEQLIAGGKSSAENFIEAFEFGVSSKGLGVSNREAITFARKMTLASQNTH